jgi:hypothetical protein
MLPGKLQLGSEGAFVDYEIQTKWENNKRLITGRCVLRQSPGPELSNALLRLTAANLVTDEGQALRVEFTKYANGVEIEFVVLPPTGYPLNR